MMHAEVRTLFDPRGPLARKNHLFVEAGTGLMQADTRQKDLFERADDAETIDRLKKWALTAATGARRALPCAVSNDLWRQISRDRDLCLGRQGPFWADCLFRKDWQRTRQAQILVINHSLFFAGHLTADAVIFDEAHHLPEVACQFLGLSLSSRAVERLLQEFHNPATGKGLVKRLARSGVWKESMEQAIAAALGASHRFFETARDVLGLRRTDGREKIERIHDFLTCAKPDFAWWAELTRYRSVIGLELRAAPLDISTYFQESVFKTHDSVILTSATLTAGGSFQLLRSELGGTKGEEKLLASPFRYDRQAGLYIAHDIPDPRRDPDAFEKTVFARCSQLIPLIPGGLFILFTSWGMLERFAKQLSPDKRTVFKQGDDVPGKLVDGFKKAGNGILLGTSTFWEGVDVPGQALSGVIITKLPFLSPESPYEEAKQEWLSARGINVFNAYLLPKAVVKFRQGFGRLIRSRTDHGLVAVLDPRIESKRYGQIFRQSLPHCQRLSDLAGIPAFFENARAAMPYKSLLTNP